MMHRNPAAEEAQRELVQFLSTAIVFIMTATSIHTVPQPNCALTPEGSSQGLYKDTEVVQILTQNTF